jgi:hypothetical protein
VCADNKRKFDCCSDTVNNDFVLQSMIEDSLNIQDNIQAETYSQIVNSKFLTETLWTRRAGASVPLQAEHRAALHAVHLFADAGHVPVRTYSVEDTAVALNEASLWETCTSRVAGLFATLPFTDQAVNEERKLKASTVHARPGTFAEFDPSVDYAEDRVHSMELLVEAVLERSRALVPHFWTHAHRYVASDSVWCERANRTFTEPAKTTMPPKLKDHGLRAEKVMAPSADQLLYPADVLEACACGWTEAEGTCYVPSKVCVQGSGMLNSSEARLADGRLQREVWAELCEGRVSTTYTTADDLLAVLQVLQNLDASVLQNCSARQLSLAWGLLAPEQHDTARACTKARRSATQCVSLAASPGRISAGRLRLLVHSTSSSIAPRRRAGAACRRPAVL